MLKVVRFNPIDNNAESPVFYEVSLQEGKLFLGYSDKGKDIERSITIDLSSYRRGVVLQANLINTEVFNEFHVVEIMQLFDSRTYGVRPMMEGIKVAVIVIEENSDITVALLRDTANLDTNADEVMVYERDVTSIFAIKENSPYYAKMWDKLKVKGPFLSNVDVFNSVSYLEAQVDVLTRALLSLLPVGASWREFLLAADAHSVLDIKAREKVLAEFNEGKARMRGLQQTYYEKTQDR